MAFIHIANNTHDDFPGESRRGYGRPIFKYLQRKHADQLVRHGQLRIGSLFYYRREFELGKIRGDTSEGSLKAVNWYGNNERSLNWEMRKAGINASFSNISSNVPHEPLYRFSAQSFDYHLYCATATPSRETMEEFECDACVVIFDTALFFERLTDYLAKWHGLKRVYDLQPVTYGSRKVAGIPGPATRATPWLIKEPEFKRQAEVRVRWAPALRNSGELRDIGVVRVEGLVNCCRRLE